MSWKQPGNPSLQQSEPGCIDTLQTGCQTTRSSIGTGLRTQHWNRPKDTTSIDGQGGFPNRSGGGGKLAMVGQGGNQRVARFGNQGAQPSSKSIIG